MWRIIYSDIMDARGKIHVTYNSRPMPEPAWVGNFADVVTTLAKLASKHIQCEPGWEYALREEDLMDELVQEALDIDRRDTAGGAFIPCCLNL